MDRGVLVAGLPEELDDRSATASPAEPTARGAITPVGLGPRPDGVETAPTAERGMAALGRFRTASSQEAGHGDDAG
ncbi:hypothetical protein EBN88_06725 [Streptomyces triticirhizae]|uniref:Uncharacterized protein n=1 Tax=Streptomyces triticirhizae TaxID=2483353 RepID=A0A3M2M1S5_9ACTN|nr:hypothetical protein EBN88_06725 [Streptomyces triticirhizae]